MSLHWNGVHVGDNQSVREFISWLFLHVILIKQSFAIAPREGRKKKSALQSLDILFPIPS